MRTMGQDGLQAKAREHGGNHRAGPPILLREGQLSVEQFIDDGTHLFSAILDGVAPFVCEANERARHFR